MATISRIFGTDTQLVNDNTITNTEEFSGYVNHETNGDEGSHITAQVVFHASGTQDLIVNIYGSLDATNPDTIALASVRIPVTAGATKQVSFIIKDVCQWRVGYLTAAAEANSPTLEVRYQTWRWQSV